MTSIHSALVVSASGQMRIENVPTKRPQAGEMLVAPLRASICGSDLDLLRGTRPVGTSILGHEGIAEVVAPGPENTPFSVGQRVTFLPNNPNNLDDILGVSTEGLFQRALLISQPALERGMVLPCDPQLPLVCGPLLEPFASVIYGQCLLEQIENPKSMVVMGAGAIGLLNVLYARAQGCSDIFLVDTSAARLNWAVKRGIVEQSHALLNSPHLAMTLLERTAGQGVDVAYLCTPRSATRAVLEQALHFVREEGGINLTAGTDSREPLSILPEVDISQIRQANVCGLGHQVKQYRTQQGKRLWLTGHSGASAQYIQEAMKLLLNHPTTYAKVISHVVSYRAVPRILDALLDPKTQPMSDAPYIKVIIDLTMEESVIEEFDPSGRMMTVS